MLLFWDKEQTHFKNKNKKKKTLQHLGLSYLSYFPYNWRTPVCKCSSHAGLTFHTNIHTSKYTLLSSFITILLNYFFFFFFRKFFITPLDEVIFYIMHFPDLYNCLSQLSTVIILISDIWM